MLLDEYQRKRDFKKTKEPKGKTVSRTGHRFVIQKHAASHLHYDFRLEMGGTLKSWAVPKGVPYAMGEKRLAVHVEDHPVSYIDFEGTIPQGQYGGGTVMVWDQGTYECLSGKPEQAYAKGRLHLLLKGDKLQGEWHLIRLRDPKHWLLFKGNKAMKPLSVRADDSSALSGRTMQAISRSTKVWDSKRVKQPAPATRSATRYGSSKKSAFPDFIEPMKAQLVDRSPPGNWWYEVKFDGFRALAFLNRKERRLLSRNDKDLADRFPDIYTAVRELPLDDTILDGEIVALDHRGKSSFALLQAYDLGEKKPPLFYYVFDILRLKGRDLTSEPLETRKELLEEALEKVPIPIRVSHSLKGNVETLLKQASKLGLEGLIGKRVGSVYEVGRRSGSWIKLKLQQEQEFVIGGFTDPSGSRAQFGSLIVGYYKQNQLWCAGKVGSGFSDAVLKSLGQELASRSQKDCPFANLPDQRAGRYGAGITAAVMRRCHWVKPRLVCQLKFSEWTRDGKLRHPVFLGLREDKSAQEVVRETTH